MNLQVPSSLLSLVLSQAQVGELTPAMSYFCSTGKCDQLSRIDQVILPIASVEDVRDAVQRQTTSTREALRRQHELSVHLRRQMRDAEERLSGITDALQRSVLQELHLRHQLQLLQG